MTPIVILHGWNSQLSRWQPVVSLLEKSNFTVFLPALPGFNRQPLNRPFSTSDYVAWVKQYLQKQKIRHCILLGHSLGGQIATQFSAKYPQLIEKLILVNSAGIRPKLTLKRLLFTPLAKLGKWFFSLKPLQPLRRPFREILYFAAREADYFQASPVMKQTLIQVIKEDQQPYLKKITFPTLIIWGQLDKLTPLKYGRKIHRLIVGSRLIILPDARHSLPFTHPKTLVNEITRFLKT